MNIAEVAAPLARLIGHSLAAAVGFCALAAISLIPIQVVKALIVLGFSQITRQFRYSSRRSCLRTFACSQ